MGLRRATPDDIGDLVRLRRVMFDAMEVDASDPAWAEECAAVLRRELAPGGTMAAYVVESGGAVVSGGVGMVAPRLPGPRTPDGRYGYVQSIATDPEHRGKGYARAVFGALVGWFEEQGVTSVGLHATPAGAAIYESFGFSPGRFPYLSRHAAR